MSDIYGASIGGGPGQSTQRQPAPVRRRPTTITTVGNTLTWQEIADYYGVSVERLVERAPGLTDRQRANIMARPQLTARGGIELRVPNVRDEVGGQRRRQNVFRNQGYIRRTTNAREQGGGQSGVPADDPTDPAADDTGGGTTTAGNPGGGGAIDSDGGMTDAEATFAAEEIIASYPWLADLGLTKLISDSLKEGRGTEFILEQIRNEQSYKDMFPNIRRSDGTMRMNEGQYMTQMDTYRSVVQRFGLDYDNAALSGFLGADIDANELTQRLQTWDAVQRGSADLRAAFYVYAGISFSDDDLYRFAVDEDYQESVMTEYQDRAGSVDYQTFLARAAEIASATHDVGFDMETNVALMDQLLHGGDPANGQYLSLNELLNAYDAAMIASAATSVGLALPDLSRIEEFRMMGVTHAQARGQYGQFVRDENFLNSVVERARGQEFGQSEFEEATFLSDAEQQRNLARGLAQEETRSDRAGSFGFGQQGGRLAQEGLSAFRD